MTNEEYRASLSAIKDRLMSDVDYVSAEIAKVPEAPPELAGEQAVAADTFVRKICMNTHLNWRNTIWGRNPAWRDLYKQLGCRFVRTAVGTNPATIADLKYIGGRAIGLLEDQNDRVGAQQSLDVMAANADLFIAIEGPNEPNHNNPPEWDTKVKDFMAWLYEKVNASPELRNKPLIGPSIWGRETAAYNKLGNIADRLDAGNLHYYTGGRKPTVSGFPATYDEGGDPDKTYTFEDALREARIIAPGKPMWITEAGWGVAGEGCPLSAYYVTPLAQAKYCLRMLGECYNRGIPMTALYTLIDDVRTPPRYHGMLMQDLSKRGPWFNGLTNTIDLYGDPGPEFPLGKLPIKVAAGVSRLPLMQKRNGKFVLTLWQDAESFNRTTFRDVNVPVKNTLVEFGNQVAKVQGFRPLGGTAPILDQSNVSSVTAPVPDELFILEITP